MPNLINRTGLKKFADGFWAKIKDRYDNAFVRAEIPATAKKITFTRANNTTEDVSLEKYARLQDRNEFEQDVSADNVAIIDNKYMGSNLGFTSNDRSLGFRQLTTNAFVDGYVDHIKIYVDKDNTSDTSTWKVWAITKGPNGKESDRVAKVIRNSEALKVNSITEGTETKKFVIIPVKESFTNETYFIARCLTHNVEVAQTIDPKYVNDVVNLNKSQPPDDENSQITWTDNATGNTAIMHLIGRESIGSLALKLKQTQADGSKYVKQDETTVTGGNGKAGKVAKLGDDGKLDATMLPSIAVNDYFPVDTFTNDQLRTLKYENGDVVFDRATQKRYLCVDKEHNTNNLVNAFVELNDKSGVVTSVNDVTGAVTLKIEATTEKLQLKVNDTMKSEVNIISDDEITNILDSLPQ